MIFVLALLRQRGVAGRNRNLWGALFFLALAVPLAAAPPDRARAEQLLDRATNHIDAGEYEAAVPAAREAARLFAALGDAHNHTASLNEAGLAQLYAGQYPAARASFEEALGVAVRSDDAEGLVEERMNLGSVDF